LPELQPHITLLKKTAEPCSKHNRKCNGFQIKSNQIPFIVTSPFNSFNGNYNGVYWYVMDSIGGMLNYIGKINFVRFLLEKANGL